jgi:hypothetical protein
MRNSLIRAAGHAVTDCTKNPFSFDEDEKSIIDSETIGQLN